MAKVTVDPKLCVGHGQCAMMAPEVFDLDADGYASVLGAEVSGNLQRDAENAAGACPAGAIAIEG